MLGLVYVRMISYVILCIFWRLLFVSVSGVVCWETNEMKWLA